MVDNFEIVDEAVNAKEWLQNLWQNESTIPKDVALFKELMLCTRYSMSDLRNYFYKHLSMEIKNKLMHTGHSI